MEVITLGAIRHMERETFGKIVQRCREALGWTQQELAEAMHTQQSTVSGWEARAAPIRDKPTLLRLARVLGTNVTVLNGGTPLPNLSGNVESLDVFEVPDEELIRQLASRHFGPNADWRKLARIFELYRRFDEAGRDESLDLFEWLAERRNKHRPQAREEEEAQEG